MTNPILAPAARYKARADVYAALLREWSRSEFDLLEVRMDKELDAVIYECPLCGAYTLSEWPEVVHTDDCLIARTPRALAANDAAIRAMAAEILEETNE